jgi:hypothetical protein
MLGLINNELPKDSLSHMPQPDWIRKMDYLVDFPPDFK